MPNIPSTLPADSWSGHDLGRAINEETGLDLNPVVGSGILHDLKRQFDDATVTEATYLDIKIPRTVAAGDTLVPYENHSAAGYGIRKTEGKRIVDAYAANRKKNMETAKPAGFWGAKELWEALDAAGARTSRGTKYTPTGASGIIRNIRKKFRAEEAPEEVAEAGAEGETDAAPAKPSVESVEHYGVTVPKDAIATYTTEGGLLGYAIRSDIGEQLVAALKKQNDAIIAKGGHRIRRWGPGIPESHIRNPGSNTGTPESPER